MGKKEKFIGVLPVGTVSDLASKVVAAHITSIFTLPTKVLPCLKHPSYAFDKKRSQYDAGAIINFMENSYMGNDEKIICICDLDLFVPIFTHVFGQARQGGKCAVVSIYRFYAAQSSDPDPGMYERLAKISLHELGHLFDMIHCSDERCLMHYSDSIETLDNIMMNFCRYCSKAFNTHFS